MTIFRSPLRVLRTQAEKIAKMLKAAERGEVVAADPGGNIAAARVGESVTFAIAMDDKILKIEMSWAAIRDTSESGIAEYILRQMRDDRDVAN